MSISGLLYLRVKQPNAKRPIKVNLIFPIIFLITCGFLVISSCYVSPVEVGVGCVIIISGNDVKKTLVEDFSKELCLCRNSRLLCNYSPAHRVADAVVGQLQFVLFKTFPVHTEPRRKGWIMLVEASPLHVPSQGAYKTYTISSWFLIL